MRLRLAVRPRPPLPVIHETRDTRHVLTSPADDHSCLASMLIENNETFLSELSKLFAEGQTSGQSLFLTMKRYSGRTKPLQRKHSEPTYKPVHRSPDGEESTENKCLIRAKLGNRKISTVISAKDVNRFQMAYSNLLKGNLHGLKKKDRKKETKGGTSASRATQ